MLNPTHTFNQTHHRAPWAHRLAIALVFLGAILNLFYLFNHSQLNLSEDESHYWEWSRHLDYGYYSKPPGIAWVIAGAVRFGQWLHLTDNSPASLMPIVRLPAVLFGFLSGLLTLSLARRIFNDNRAALASILLSAAVPMFGLGSLLITIDSPMYLCWAATIYCLWRAIEPPHTPRTTNHEPRPLWLYLAGLACAIGMLFKPVLIAIPLCAAVAAYADPAIRRAFKTWHTLPAAAFVLLSQLPVLLWNSQHNWVMFQHISTQGFSSGPQPNRLMAAISHLGEYIGGQAGGMGGLMFVLLLIAVILAIKKCRQSTRSNNSEFRTHNSELVFLLAFTLPLWLFYFLINFWKNTEINWPAASYFTGMILLAGIFTEGWNSPVPSTRKWWRTWGTITILWGILLTALALNLHRFYPWAASHLATIDPATPQYRKSLYFPTHWDPALKKLRGFDLRADAVQTAREAFAKELGQEPLLIADRYGTASSLSFYLPDHPFIYCVMSSVGGRRNQYDLWPTLNQKDAAGKLLHAGQSALIIGTNPDDKETILSALRPAFDHIQGPQLLPILYQGILINQVPIYKAYNFKGLPTSTHDGGY